MKDRPPDPHQHNPLTYSDNFTDGNPKSQPTDAIFVESTVKASGQTSAKSPLPATSILDQNQPKINRPIDPSQQQTPTHVISAKPTEPPVSTDHINNSKEPLTGKNGTSVDELNQNHPQSNAYDLNEQFPKLTSNFDRPRKNQKSNFASVTKTHPPSIRNNGQQTTEPPPSSQKNQTVIPTIQKIKAKFNDHSNTNTQTNYKPNAFSEPTPPTVVPTFASKLRADRPVLPKIELAPTRKTTKQGYPAVIFKREDFMVKLAARCKYTVIGKFSSTMPKMELIRSSLTAQLQLKGSLKVTHFNSRHIYIDLDNEHDHATVWHKEKIYVEGRPVRLFVWTPTFKPEQETPIAPVWVVLPQLPWHCYCMEMVSELLEPVGRALFLDAASFQKTRGSVAKVKIELDLTKPRPKYVWLGYDDDEFGEGQWQEIQYENVPDYCMYCKHKGHSEHSCTIKGRDDESQKRNVHQEAEVPMSSRVMQNDQNPPNTQRRNELPTHPNKDTTDRKVVKQVYVAKKNVFNTVNAKDTQLPVVSSSIRGGILVPQGEKDDDKIHYLSSAEPVKNDLKDLHCQNPFDVLVEATDIAGQIVPVNNGGTSMALTNCGVPEKRADMHDYSKAEQFNAATGSNQQHTAAVAEKINFFGNVLPTVKRLSSLLDGKPVAQPSPIAEHRQFIETSQTCPTKAPVSASCAPTVKNATMLHCTDIVDAGEILQQAGKVRKIKDAVAGLTNALTTPNSGNLNNMVTVTKEIPNDIENFLVPVPVQIDGYGHSTGNVQSNVESTKAWVMRSFGTTDKVPSPKPATVLIQQLMPSRAICNDNPTAPAVNSGKNPCKAAQKSKKKKPGKKTDATTEKGNKGEVTHQVQQETEEEVRKANIRAWQDAILAKSYEEIPTKNADNSESSFVRQGAIGCETLSADLTPTTQLVEICKATTRLKNLPKQLHSKFKNTSNSTITMNVENGNDSETYFLGDIFREPQQGDKAPSEPETYFLGDIFNDAQHGDKTPKVDGEKVNTPNTSGKHMWNVNAPEFIPKASPQLGVSLPEDDVLLERMDLHDKKGLLRRQNAVHKDFPSKISIVPPGFVDSDPEYEDEDEFSIADNEMHAARIGALSPRVEEIKRQKKIIRKRAPLERRTQPSRSSKMKSTRSNDYVW